MSNEDISVNKSIANSDLLDKIKSETIVLVEKASKQQMAVEDANHRQGGNLETITYDCSCKKIKKNQKLIKLLI